MAESGAGAATRSEAIALELALSANHACQALGLGHARVIGHCVILLAIVAAVGITRRARHFSRLRRGARC